MGNSVLLGMSGGVDSTASAIILKERGFEVTGATFILSDEPSFKKSVEDSKKAAKKIGINHIVLDYRNEFKKEVINYFVTEYSKGRTPNPCVICNKQIKFGKFIETADSLGIRYVATGTYAKVIKENNKYKIVKPANKNKDQTYFLYYLNQNILKRVVFPLGDIQSKDLTREIVKESNIEIYKKKDSQEICFIKDNKYFDFISDYSKINIKKGNFIDKNGNVLGKHNGVINYTIGQRKGLGIALGKPTYVIDINVKNNTVTLGNNEDLFKDSLSISNYNFIDNEFDFEKALLSAKIRYTAKEENVKLEKKENYIHVKFENPVRAIAKGQSIVFYQNDMLVGGGIID